MRGLLPGRLLSLGVLACLLLPGSLFSLGLLSLGLLSLLAKRLLLLSEDFLLSKLLLLSKLCLLLEVCLMLPQDFLLSKFLLLLEVGLVLALGLLALELCLQKGLLVAPELIDPRLLRCARSLLLFPESVISSLLLSPRSLPCSLLPGLLCLPRSLLSRSCRMPGQESFSCKIVAPKSIRFDWSVNNTMPSSCLAFSMLGLLTCSLREELRLCEL